MIWKIIYVAALLMVTLFGCSEEIDPVGTVEKAEEIKKPFDLEASIGDGKVVLSWSVSDGSAVLYYNLYYAGTASIEEMNLIDTTDATTFTFEGLSNDRIYYFRVASVGAAGLEGEMSEAVGTIPSIFAITIDNFSHYTNSRNVIISSIAPEGTTLIELSEDSSFNTGVNTLPYDEAVSFELSDNDGVKKVYARFSLTGGGSAADIVSDSIILDREAKINGITVVGPGDSTLTSNVTLSSGDEIKFYIHVNRSDSGGEAGVNIPGLVTLDLLDFTDDGADSGVYSGSYTIPVNTELTDAEITGGFIDAAGNEAPELKADILLSVASLPDTVLLSGLAISSTEIELDWTKSTISNFANYRLFRSSSAGVSDTSRYVTTIGSQAVLNYVDFENIDADWTYYYRLYVYDDRGNSTGSNVDSVTTPADEPPDTVVLSGFAISSSEIELDWTKSTISNFANYRLFRSYSDQVSDTSLAVTTIGSQVVLNYVDGDNLDADSTYYYRLYVYDDNGNSTASNYIAVTTPINEPPDAVVLSGFAVSSSEIEISWTRSDITDFSAYRLFRSDTGPATDADFYVTTNTSQSVLKYNDTGLDEDSLYNYVLYVYDDAGNSTPSNNVSITTDPNVAPEAVILVVNVVDSTAELSWTESPDSDFKAYHILRDTLTIPAYDLTKVIKIINSKTQISYSDSPTADTSYYQVWVVDEQDGKTGSNEVEVTIP